MSAYLSAYIEDCRAVGHHFIVAGSDKTPMLRSLICATCTERNPGKTVYAAYGIEHGSFGAWRRTKRKDADIEDA